MVTDYEIHLQALRFYAFHGVLPQERVVGGEYVVDVRLQVAPTKPVVAAMAHDAIEGLISYADVYEDVRRAMKEPRATLEAVAHSLAHALLEKYSAVSAAEVCLTKCTPPCGMEGSASVKIRAVRA